MDHATRFDDRSPTPCTNPIIQNLYIDEKVDHDLNTLAYQKRVAKGELMGQYLVLGMQRNQTLESQGSTSLFDDCRQSTPNNPSLVLRTLTIDSQVYAELRTQAYQQKVSKSELMRQYLTLGMQ